MITVFFVNTAPTRHFVYPTKLTFLFIALMQLAAHAGASYSYVGKCSENLFTVPSSPALEKCSECAIDDNGTLECTCPGPGGPQTSQLPLYFCWKYYAYPICASSIEVIEGRLSCKKIHPKSRYNDQGCFDCVSENGVLTCECVREKRAHGPSQLDMSGCDAPVSSCQGVLTCGECPERAVSRDWIWLKASVFSASIVGISFVLVKRFIWKSSVA